MVHEIKEKNLFQTARQSAKEIGYKTLGAYLSMAVLFIAITVTFALSQYRQTVTQHAAGSNSPCQFQLSDPGTNIAFCETFDQPSPVNPNSRSGQLDDTIWGASRVTGYSNFGQGNYDSWAPAHLDICGNVQQVYPPNDIQICNGTLREANNDNASGGFEAGTVTTLAMYPKQPFDFNGRTGTIVFDVTDDSTGTHSSWPELWLTDKPIPAPFVHFGNWDNPQNGFGIRFAASYHPGDGSNFCPDDGTHRIFADSLAVFRNYVVEDDAISATTFTNTNLGCVHAASGPNGPLNHVEIRVSQNTIDVWMTDPGSTTLVHTNRFDNVNLTLSKGLIWLEDAHYNADKGDSNFPSQKDHTYTWDNVGFDGPYTYNDLAFDAPDGTNPSTSGTVNLGFPSSSTSPHTWTINNVSGVGNATSGLLTFGFYKESSVSTIFYSVNGNPAHSFNLTGIDTEALGVPVPLSEVKTGTNTVQVWADQFIGVFNVDLIMVAASHRLPTTPTPTGQATPTPAPIPSSTPTPAPNATATPTPTPIPALSTLSLSPTSQSVTAGQTFTSKVVVNTNGQSVNGVQTNITYPTNLLSVVSVDKTGSVFDVEAHNTNSNGTISIAYGATVPQNGSNLLVTTVTFQALANGTANVNFSNPLVVSSVSNTNVLKSSTNGTYSIVAPTPTPTPLPTATPTPAGIPGDIIKDGVVNVQDLSYLLRFWGSNDTLADISGDGKVDIFDLSTLLRNWTK